MATVTRLPFQRRAPGAEPPTPRSGIDDHPFDPRRLIGALLRRRYLIGSILALGVGIGILYGNQITPLYSAQTTLLIEGAQQKVVNIESVAQGIKPDFYTNETQAAVIRSRDLIGKVVDRLDLQASPLFNPELAPRQAGTLDAVKALFAGWFGGDDAAGAARDPYAGLSPEERRTARREALIDAFLGGLTVTPSQRALLVTVEYVSPDAEMAAKAANAVAEAYLAQQVEKKDTVTQRATEWLAERATELRTQVIESERRLEEFRRKSGITEVQGVNLLREQMAKVNTDLIAARTGRSEAEARYHQVQSLLRTSRGIDTAAAVLDSPLIQRLREQETQVVRKLGELRTRLRSGHPNMILAESELADLQSKIAAEVNKIAVNLGNELEIARVRERNLQAELHRLERQVDEQNAAAVSLKTLQTEAQANKQLFDTINARFKETSVVDESLQQADARIISRATVPWAPFYPQKRVIVGIALFFSLMVGVGIAIVLELLDSGFRTPEQLEDMTGLPTIGSVPRLPRADRRRFPHEIISARPNSAFSESVRSVRTALMLSDPENAPRSVLITSSVSGEGKTSLSLSLASLAARSGQRVIALDCDFRHPNLHLALGVGNDRGLSNYLTGQAELAEVVEIDPATGLHFIAAGTRAPHPTDLLNSERMNALLRRLETTYDLVVLDAPPLLAVSDALVLVRVVDRVVYLVRWEKVRRETVLAGIRQLADAGAHIAGNVLTQIDVRKQSRYGYQGAGGSYYYGHNSKYYGD